MDVDMKQGTTDTVNGLTFERSLREQTMLALGSVDPELRQFIKQVVYQVLGELQLMKIPLDSLVNGIITNPPAEWIEQNGKSARPLPYRVTLDPRG